MRLVYFTVTGLLNRRRVKRRAHLSSHICHNTHPSSFCRSRDKLEFCHSTASSRPLSDNDRASIDEFRVLSCAQCNLSRWRCQYSSARLSVLSINLVSIRALCTIVIAIPGYVHDNGNLRCEDRRNN